MLYLMYNVTIVVFVTRVCCLSPLASTTLHRHCFTVSAVVTAFFMYAGYYIIIIVIISYGIYIQTNRQNNINYYYVRVHV